MTEPPTTRLSDEDAAAWLLWQAEMGADELIADAPCDYFALKPQPQPQPQPLARTAAPQVAAPPKPAPASRPTTARAAPVVAAPISHCGTLDALREAVAAFEGCGLKRTAKSLCLYRGAKQAPVMLIGEAPGRDEDLSGQPFVGRAGHLLDRMLASIGLDQSSVHITNLVYWRPPGNRNPSPEEVEACRPFLARQIELVAPDCIVALGGPAAKALTGVADGIMRMRGRWRNIDIGGRNVPLLPTLHPAYLLRTPAAKRFTWRDLLALKRFLDTGAT